MAEGLSLLASPSRTVLLTCLESIRLLRARAPTRQGVDVPEPPGHVEMLVPGWACKLPERFHICLGEGVALEVTTGAEVFIQSLHPGLLFTNAQNKTVAESCGNRGTRHQ